MDDQKQIRLTSAEIAQLWAQYMNDSASICTLSYFLEKAEDTEIKPLIKFALDLSQSHIKAITSILKEEKNKLPHGFKVEADTDVPAPRLYSDSYVLNFLHQMAKIGLTTYATSVSSSIRSDITEYYIKCIDETKELFVKSKELLLEKGLFVRPPYLPNLEEIQFVEKQGFMWEVIGDKRPLTAMEIANLYADYQRNALGAATLTGFIQVAQSKDIKKFFIRGIEIAKKHLKTFATKLEESNLPIPTTWASDITNSTAFTFSDKLMMFYTTSLISLSIGYYGTGVSQSMRADLSVMYNRLSAEIQLYIEDGANIMIKNKWLEQPPMAADRDELAMKNKK